MSNDVNFKRLNELEVIEEASESTYAVVEENGVPKRIPGKKIGGGLPEGGAPYQQLVTDGQGVAKWEDRLCYAEKTIAEEVPETEITTEVYTDFARANMDASIYPTATEEGEIRTIVFDGVEYECALYATEGYSFGNGSLFPGSSYPDTGEPFLYVYMPDDIAVVITRDTEPTTHTISCYNTNAEIIETIDKKYLPENMYYTDGSRGSVLYHNAELTNGVTIAEFSNIRLGTDVVVHESGQKALILEVYSGGTLGYYTSSMGFITARAVGVEPV